MNKDKKLYKSTNKMVDGVCAGIAEYIGVDPTIVRVIYAVLTLCTAFAGVILYAVLAIIIPREPFPDYDYKNPDDRNGQNQ